jgi:hypothetical protein
LKVAHPLNYETFRVNFEHLFAKHIPNDLLNAQIDAITAGIDLTQELQKITTRLKVSYFTHNFI